jgi:hypothetical protein
MFDDGWFVAVLNLYGREKEVLLQVFAYQYAPIFAPIPIGNGEPIGLEITMERVPVEDKCEVRVTVVDDKEVPLVGAAVSLVMYLNCSNGPTPGALAGKTGPDGACVFQVPRGAPYGVGSRCSGYVLQRGFSLIPLETTAEVKLTMKKADPPSLRSLAALSESGGATSGGVSPTKPPARVRPGGGRGFLTASNTPLAIEGTGAAPRKASAKLRGRAMIVAPTIEDVPEDARKRLESQLAAEQERTMSGTELIAIVGRVRFADGAAVKGPKDVGMGIDSVAGAFPVQIYDDGWFTATCHVRQTSALLKVFAHTYYPLYVPFSIGKKGLVRFDIALERARPADFGEVRVTVVDSKGGPVAGATVLLDMGLSATHGIGSTPESLKAVSAEDGTCVFPVIQGGQYLVGSFTRGYTSASSFVEAEQKATAVKLTLAAGSR